MAFDIAQDLRVSMVDIISIEVEFSWKLEIIHVRRNQYENSVQDFQNFTISTRNLLRAETFRKNTVFN